LFYREALIVVAIPMFASGASTVITTTPLFAVQTLVLNRFAAVILVTMVTGLAYVVLFMAPLLAMFGPGYNKKAHEDLMQKDLPLEKIIRASLIRSMSVRFLLIIVITILVFVRPRSAPSPCLSRNVFLYQCYSSNPGGSRPS
jgi:hypothetical protein